MSSSAPPPCRAKSQEASQAQDRRLSDGVAPPPPQMVFALIEKPRTTAGQGKTNCYPHIFEPFDAGATEIESWDISINPHSRLGSGLRSRFNNSIHVVGHATHGLITDNFLSIVVPLPPLRFFTPTAPCLLLARLFANDQEMRSPLLQLVPCLICN